VTNARETRELLGIDEGLEMPEAWRDDSAPPRTPPLHERVLDALPLRGGRTQAEVARRAGLSLGDARGALAELELLGRVARREPSEGGETLWVLSRG